MPKKVDLFQLNWMEVGQYLVEDTRIVVPLGATEEHGYLSLLTDTLFVSEVTRRACERAQVLLAPASPFGCSAFAINFPGTISLRTVTLCHVVEDIADCLYRQGFRRIVFVTGHGGNEVITGVLSELQLGRERLNVYYKNAWAPIYDAIRRMQLEPTVGKPEHGSWHEVYPFTRVSPIPDLQKDFPQTPDFPSFPLNPRTARKYLGDGVVSGKYTLRDTEITAALLQVSVDELAQFLIDLPKAPAED